MESHPMQDLPNKGFGQLDFILTERHNLHQITDAYSNRNAALQSHHFLLSAHMNFDIPKYQKRSRSKRKQLRAIESPSEQQVLANNFVQMFHHQMHNFSEFATSDIIEDKYTTINHALHKAASKQEIPGKSIPLRP